MNLELVKALKVYDLPNASAELLRCYDNSVYKIEVETRIYALRICSPKTARKQLRAEVAWLSALREDKSLLVPKPVPNKQGDLISYLADRTVVMFEWLPGEPVSQTMSPEVARQIGQMMATLHLHASNYSSDRQTVCYDSSYFFGSNSWWQTKARERLADNYQKLVPAIEKVENLMSEMEKSPEQFGMIHSDLHFSNIICDGEKYAIIDFGDCGMGYYAMDITVTEAEFKDYDNAEQLITAFRDGYQNKRGCFPSSEKLEPFGVVGSLLWLEWVFESENQQVREDKAQWLDSVIRTVCDV